MVFGSQIVFLRYQIVPKAIKQRLTRQRAGSKPEQGFWTQQHSYLRGAVTRAHLSISLRRAQATPRERSTPILRAKKLFSWSFSTLISGVRLMLWRSFWRRTFPASELVSLIRNSESNRVSDFDFGLLSAEFQLQACRDKTFAKTYAKLHRTHVDTMAGLITKLFTKLDRTPPSEPRDLAEIIMALTTGLFLQRTSVQGPLRKGFLTAAILLVLGLSPIEGDR